MRQLQFKTESLENRRGILSLGWHQPFVRTAERQLNPECGSDQDVDFSGFDFLQVARGDFSAFGQLVLRHTPVYPLPTHVRAKDLDSLPFFTGNCHDILHRFLMVKMNDTYIVKIILLAHRCACI